MTEKSSSDVPMVTLVSLDDHKFTLPVDAAKESEMVSNALGLGDDDDDDNADEIPIVHVTKVESKCLEYIVKFLNHNLEEKMNDIPVPLPGNQFDLVRLFSHYCFLFFILFCFCFVVFLVNSPEKRISLSLSPFPRNT